MGSANLDNLAKIGLLKKEAPDQSEIDGLIASGKVRLEDAENTDLSLESRFDLAYNACHAFALAALRFHGFRAEKRYVVFQALEHTVGFAPNKWRVLSQAHERRNRVEYEGAVEVEESLVAALLKLGKELGDLVSKLGPLP